MFFPGNQARQQFVVCVEKPAASSGGYSGNVEMEGGECYMLGLVSLNPIV